MTNPTPQSPSVHSLEAEHLGDPPQARSEPPPHTAPVARDNKPAGAAMEVSPKSQHKVKQRTTSALLSHCLPSSEIGAVEYQTRCMYKGTIYFHMRNAN